MSSGASKVTIGLAMHWPCITEFVVYTTGCLKGLGTQGEEHACNGPKYCGTSNYLLATIRVLCYLVVKLSLLVQLQIFCTFLISSLADLCNTAVHTTHIFKDLLDYFWQLLDMELEPFAQVLRNTLGGTRHCK